MKKTLAFIILFSLICAMPGLATASQIELTLATAIEQLGAPYELYSDAPFSFNCFTFVAYCFNEVVPGLISLDGIAADYEKITSIRDVKPGDIIGFKSSKNLRGILGYHFGIYIGKGYFIHAANKTDGVIVSRLKDYK